MVYSRELFPLIDSVTNRRSQAADLIAERSFNQDYDLWLPDHKPFKFMRHPIVSAVMAVEMFTEACRMLHPDLKVTGIRDAQFMDIVECPKGVSRDVSVHCKTLSRNADELVCDAFLATKEMSPTGRALDRLNLKYRALVLMGAVSPPDNDPPDFPVAMEELDTRHMGRPEVVKWYQDRSDLLNRYRVLAELDGTGPGAIRGRTIYRCHAGDDFKPPRRANYQFSPYLLEALLQLVGFYVVMRDEAEQRSMIPVGIGEAIFRRKCVDGEEVYIEARMRRQDQEGLTWDARALGRDDEVIMTLRDLRMSWFSN
jgi:hypothetical protein